MNLIDKVFLSHPEFQLKNFSLIINFLLDNSYAFDFIFSCIRKRLATKIHRNNQLNTSVNSKHNDYFVIPYVKRTSENFMQFFKSIPNIKFLFWYQLSSIIKVQKDPLPPLSHSNVVYKLHCIHCDASYVGQIHRLVKTRIDEHGSHIRRNTNQSSVITEHRLEFSHDFDWDNVEILDEKIHYKRIISEMIYIKKQSHSLNLQHDTDSLDPIYFDIIL